MRKLLRAQGITPRVKITDKLRSCSASNAELIPGAEHRSHRDLNNRADHDAVTGYAMEVLDSTDLAMGFHNNPPRVKTDLHWSDLLKLAKPDMAVMCCCSPNPGLVVPTMTLGGHGTGAGQKIRLQREGDSLAADE